MFVDFTRDFVFGRETVTQKNLIEKAAIFNISLPKLFLPFCKYYLHHHFGRGSLHHQENILVRKKCEFIKFDESMIHWDKIYMSKLIWIQKHKNHDN